ncbi:TIGR04222 domain-containing membrane protein [Saccharomonospora azurea]|uniref:TIGR04222 domain-containing membrane protein n=1 Tax=Saccharomonospora azurea TaxID=40988 RepID=UPI0002400A48|nr:TIGR04222 domain-containing membrane protein [Saccharomonospora azurea]EHK85285.1 hypothetical protein SZMC14600_16671 [Saccharomonospora azurea SZMC 14600]
MHPWGLSGPQFLWLYGVGLLAGLIVAIGNWMGVRRPRSQEASGPLTAEELGFLVAGPRRAIAVAISRLVAAQLVRVSRDGRLTAVAGTRPTGRPLEDAVLTRLGSGSTLTVVTRELAAEPVVTRIGESLVRRGLLVSPSRAAQARSVAVLVLGVVFLVGVVRWINGLVDDFPVGYLTVLLLLTLVALVVFAAQTSESRTVTGDQVVAESETKRTTMEWLGQVAVTGVSAYPDPTVAAALAAATPAVKVTEGSSRLSELPASPPTWVGSADSGSSDGGGHSCGSGSSGSSCGGGGCGGGGA